jgi:hypothetical protein
MNEVKIRKFTKKDSYEAGILVSDTYRKYNLAHIDDAKAGPYLGDFFILQVKGT